MDRPHLHPRCEALLAAIVPAQGDGHAEGGLAFVGRGLDDFRTRAPRPPVTDFPQSGGGSLHVAFVCCGPVRRLETAESGLDGRKPRFRHEIAVRTISAGREVRPSWSSVSLTNARLMAVTDDAPGFASP